MTKQQTAKTSMGELTFTSLSLSELRQLDALFKESNSLDDKSMTTLLKYMPIILASARKVHQDVTAEQMEAGLDLEDFNACFNTVLEVSGLKKAEGEATAATA